ncbi:hypothetical protein AB5I41_03225 [Sphingomonas sp. MMS24-JH45]
MASGSAPRSVAGQQAAVARDDGLVDRLFQMDRRDRRDRAVERGRQMAVDDIAGIVEKGEAGRRSLPRTAASPIPSSRRRRMNAMGRRERFQVGTRVRGVKMGGFGLGGFPVRQHRSSLR